LSFGPIAALADVVKRGDNAAAATPVSARKFRRDNSVIGNAPPDFAYYRRMMRRTQALRKSRRHWAFACGDGSESSMLVRRPARRQAWTDPAAAVGNDQCTSGAHHALTIPEQLFRMHVLILWIATERSDASAVTSPLNWRTA
jgi:hypothetical protein